MQFNSNWYSPAANVFTGQLTEASAGGGFGVDLKTNTTFAAGSQFNTAGGTVTVTTWG